MKTKIILVTLMIVLSMLTVSVAEEGTFKIDDTIEDVDIDLTVDYDADTSTNPCTGDNQYSEGKYEIEGIMKYDEESYNAELDANGCIILNNENVKHLSLYNIDGKVYQNGETQYLYKDKNNEYYGYVESGYNVYGYEDGQIVNGMILYFDSDFVEGWLETEYFYAELSFEGYSKYVITKSKPRGEFTLNSPLLGLGYKNSVAGDQIPELFTYRDTNTWKSVTTETYPEDHDGPVIVTPARVAGEPLQENGYCDTVKGQRVSEWKTNNK